MWRVGNTAKVARMAWLSLVGLGLLGCQTARSPVESYDLTASPYLFLSSSLGRYNLFSAGENHAIDLRPTERWANLSGVRYQILNQGEYLVNLEDSIQFRSLPDHALLKRVPAQSFTCFAPVNDRGDFYFITMTRCFFYSRSTDSVTEIAEFQSMMEGKYSQLLSNVADRKTFIASHRRLSYSEKEKVLLFALHNGFLYRWKVGSSELEELGPGKDPQVTEIEGTSYLYYLEGGVLKRSPVGHFDQPEEVIRWEDAILDYEVVEPGLIFFVVSSDPNFKGSRGEWLYVWKDGRPLPVKAPEGSFLGTPIEFYYSPELLGPTANRD